MNLIAMVHKLEVNKMTKRCILFHNWEYFSVDGDKPKFFCFYESDALRICKFCNLKQKYWICPVADDGWDTIGYREFVFLLREIQVKRKNRDFYFKNEKASKKELRKIGII